MKASFFGGKRRGGQRSSGRKRQSKSVPGRRRPQFESLEDRNMLAVLTVNSLLDTTVAGDGLVTLREAIIASNNDAATDTGDVGSGADTIQFAPALTGTITLTGATALSVTDSVTINGPGATSLTINGAGGCRDFHIS